MNRRGREDEENTDDTVRPGPSHHERLTNFIIAHPDGAVTACSTLSLTIEGTHDDSR